MNKTVSWVLLASILFNICLPLYVFSAQPAITDADASISLLCNVSGAAVYLDGKETGLVTPLAEPVKTVPGFHKIRIEKEGYTVWRKEIFLTPGENYTANVVMVPLAVPREGEAEAEAAGEATAMLSITSFIEGASIYIDGNRHESLTPLSEPIVTKAGFHRLLIKKEGFISWRKEVMLAPGENMKVEAILLPLEVSDEQEEVFDEMDRKPITKRWWFWVIMLGALGAAIANEDSDDSGSVRVTW